jgi:uncharacterized membrane protein
MLNLPTATLIVLAVVLNYRIMKNRLFENWVTTCLGIVILIFCGLVIYTEKQTASDMAGWLTVGLMFLRSKDSLIALPKQ